ncbi:MAG: MlaD family protein [candidate division Zixibacteria bacterium]|nr:MlaD family protein [candidate division Zixibacteria bacterium]
MENKSVEIRVGIAVFVALTLLILGIMWLKDYRVGVSHYQVKVIFTNAGVLGPGDPVTVSGIDKGSVEKVDLYEGDVLVTFSLTEDVVLKEDASFKIANVGLMGERVIEVRTGYSSTPLDLSKIHRGSYDPGIAEVMGLSGELVAQVKNLIGSLQTALGTNKSPSTLETSLANLERASQKLDKVLGQAETVTDDISASSAEVRKFITDNKSSFQTTVDNFGAASSRLEKLTTTLESTLSSLNNLTAKIERGEGTLGQLVQDSSLYLDIKRVVFTTDSLLTDVRAHPKKYFHFSIF